MNTSRGCLTHAIFSLLDCSDKRTGQMAYNLGYDLLGIWVLYMLIDTKYPGKMKIGISCNLQNRLYSLEGEMAFTGRGR